MIMNEACPNCGSEDVTCEEQKKNAEWRTTPPTIPSKDKATPVNKVQREIQLKQMEKQMAMQQEQQVFNTLVAAHRAEIMEMRRNRDRAALQELQDRLIAETKAKVKEGGVPTFTAEQTEAYTTVGGTPFLDGQYTVFGEVESGLDVVEKIQTCETNHADRPLKDVVMEVEVIE